MADSLGSNKQAARSKFLSSQAKKRGGRGRGRGGRGGASRPARVKTEQPNGLTLDEFIHFSEEVEGPLSIPEESADRLAKNFSFLLDAGEFLRSPALFLSADSVSSPCTSGV